MEQNANKFFFIDSHFHLSVIQAEVAEILSHAKEHGVFGGIDVGLDHLDADKRTAKLESLGNSFGYSIGLYPSHADEKNIDQILLSLEVTVKKQLTDRRFVALGEMGMDFHWNYGTEKKQKKLFDSQLHMARKYQLPVIIHNRQADHTILDILKATPTDGIIHCFSSDSTIMKKFLDMGMYISFAGNLTYKNSHVIREAAETVPLDRVLFETDSPFLSPVPKRGKPNCPANVHYIYDFFSKLRNIDMEKLQTQVGQNFIRAVPRCGELLA